MPLDGPCATTQEGTTMTTKTPQPRWQLVQDAIVRSTELSTAEKCVLLVMRSLSDSNTMECWYSAEQLAPLVGIKYRQNVQRIIDRLTEKGWIESMSDQRRKARRRLTIPTAIPEDVSTAIPEDVSGAGLQSPLQSVGMSTAIPEDATAIPTETHSPSSPNPPTPPEAGEVEVTDEEIEEYLEGFPWEIYSTEREKQAHREATREELLRKKKRAAGIDTTPVPETVTEILHHLGKVSTVRSLGAEARQLHEDAPDEYTRLAREVANGVWQSIEKGETISNPTGVAVYRFKALVIDHLSEAVA